MKKGAASTLPPASTDLARGPVFFYFFFKACGGSAIQWYINNLCVHLSAHAFLDSVFMAQCTFHRWKLMNMPLLATNMHLCRRDANHKHLYLLAAAWVKVGLQEEEERLSFFCFVNRTLHLSPLSPSLSLPPSSPLSRSLSPLSLSSLSLSLSLEHICYACWRKGQVKLSFKYSPLTVRS